jgi:5-methyltetrahydrofolate--homocysteine methyltransferase
LGDAFPKWHPNYGPGILAGVFGSEVCYTDGTTWYNPLGVSSLAEIEIQFDRENIWWQRVHQITSAAVERWKGQVVIGHTDLGGNLDILASLRGTQNLLLDLYDAPEEVDRLTSKITEAWLSAYRELFDLIKPAGLGSACWGPCWSPGTTYMLQCDFAYMISPKMFERFVLPDLEACCNDLDHAFYHLDGRGQIPHLDMLLSLERLQGIQWIPGDGAPPPEDWMDLLRRIREAGKLCQVYVTPSGAFEIARELGGTGFLFYIWGEASSKDSYYRSPLNPAEAHAFIETFYKEFG